MHLNSELLLKKYALSYFKTGMRILEIGPAGFPSAYQKIVANEELDWHTIDFKDTTYIHTAVNTLTYELTSPYEFPVESEKYDIVISGQVIEHVEKIWVWLNEIKRVLKQGGIIITINPVSWPYHEAPVDCWRIYPSGIKALSEEIGLQVEKCLFESLEIDQIRSKDTNAKFIPGQSYNYSMSENKLSRIIRWNKLIRKIPHFRSYLEIPIEVSYDTISILKK